MTDHRLATSFLLAAAITATGCSKSDSAPSDIPEFSAFKDISDAPEKIRTAAQAVVRIQTGDSYATGSFISGDGLLLTNNHVLGVDVCPREGCYARITWMHQRHEAITQPVTVFFVPQHIDVGLDVAVMQAYQDSGKSAKLQSPQFLQVVSHDAPSLVGLHVNVVGHPEGHLKKWTSGDVAQTFGTWFESTAFILPGNSGSPMLDDEGNVVGLLHRGPTSQDLVTRTDINVYSIGTASAPILDAMKAPLPEATRSMAAAATADDIVAHQIVYYNAHVATVMVQDPATSAGAALPAPTEHDMLSLLGAACEVGLARTDYESPEDLAAALQPCSDALTWIDCQSSNATPPRVCPTGAEQTAWATRFKSTFDHYRKLNRQLYLDMVSYAPGALETGAQASTVSHDELQQAVADAKPPLDFNLALYFAIYGIDSYNGVSIRDFVKNYTKVPHYELSLGDIALADLWLTQNNTGTGEATFLANLKNDAKASLGSKLYIEELRYEYGTLD